MQRFPKCLALTVLAILFSQAIYSSNDKGMGEPVLCLEQDMLAKKTLVLKRKHIHPI